MAFCQGKAYIPQPRPIPPPLPIKLMTLDLVGVNALPTKLQECPASALCSKASGNK